MSSRNLARAILWCSLACGLGACADDTPPLVLETILVTDTDDPTGPYRIAAIARDDAGISGAWVFFSVDGKQSFESASLEHIGPDAYGGRIRGFPLGTRVDYYIAARDNASNVGTDPVVAPGTTYCFLIGAMPSRPRVLVVSPARGPTTGGTVLSIFGQDFRPGAKVFVDGSPALQVHVVDSNLVTAVAPPGPAGLADVTIENPAYNGPADSPCRRLGDDQPVRATLPDAFLYVAPPNPTLIVPPSGPTAGGTTVVVVGTDFVPGATVTFDGVAGVSCTFLSPSELRCITPPGDPGPADVVVTNPDGLRGSLPGGYTFVPPPQLFAIEPPRGPDTGGTAVSITGTGFDAGATFFFDDIQQRNVVVANTGLITAVTLPHPVGFVDVRVRNGDGQEARLPRAFFYYGPPIILGINPVLGPTSGGQRVTLTGSSFVPGLTVVFGGAPATIVSLTESEILVTTPPHAEGPVLVVVTNPDLRSASIGYRYVPAPEITSLAPTCGPASGGTPVTVQGLNFQPNAVLLFGDTVAATNVVSPALIQATTPARPGGIAEVRVRNPDGALSTNTGRFEFVPAPRIDAIAPTTMPLCGGAQLTLRGADFLAGATVTIGGRDCTDVSIVSGAELRCTAPPQAAGPQPIVVTNHACIDQASTGGIALDYTRLRLLPSGGLISGFTNVKVTHPNGLTRRVADVRFDGTAALEIRQAADGTSLANSPPHAVGEVAVEVTLDGCAPELAGDTFRYRVFVDETAARLTKPPCVGSISECHAAHIKFGDVNGDGLQDFVQANGGINTADRMQNQVFINDAMRPGFFVGRNLPDAAGDGPHNNGHVDLADVNGDGSLDMLITTDTGGGGLLWLNNGSGTFTLSTAPISQTLRNLPSAFDAQLVDVNNDGRIDIVYQEIGVDENNGMPRNGTDHVYLGDGQGNFTEVAAAFPAADFSVHDHKMAFGHFNTDAFLDVVFVVDSHFTPRPFPRLFFGDGQGHFRTAPAPALAAVFGDVFGVEVADFDGDGRDDIFLPVEGRVLPGGGACEFRIAGATNVLLLNDGTGNFVDRSDLLPALNEPTIHATKVDVDDDGDIDLVAVNFGQPTRIHVNDGRGRFSDASGALRNPPFCSLAAAAAPIERNAPPALLIGGNYETRLWVQTHTP